VVTGGGRGIGAEVARALAEAGFRVVVAARSEAEVAAVAAGLCQRRHDAHAVVCDVSDPESVERLRREAERAVGEVDVLVNNAGVASSSKFARQSLEEWRQLFAVNVEGVFLVTRAFLPAMVERGRGRVVNVASIAGRTGAPYIAAYASTKHAVVGMTRALAAEVAASGVTVNAVCPFYVDTPMTDRSVENIAAKTGLDAGAARERLIAANPQGRMIGPDEVAFVVATLCDERARGINGQAIGLDGGAFLG
jgi:NAD(P)-dependent dehydrogenase (short-subunit alcohol dehydrogenase family)